MSIHDSRQIENVKVMLVKGADGDNIASIEKTGTDVLVDTYTVTLTDGSKTTFQVTNGKGITSIAKTATQGLLDTYTITYNDGSTSTFDVLNGNRIVDVEKTGTNVLVDTYTMTFNDGATDTFNVTNGRGIVSIEKTATQGLVDTYTITYNDGTTSTFIVKNGSDTVDDAFSTTSTNPLENKVISNKFDTVDTAISNKADKSSAISNITRNGTTFTATKADGTTFTFTQQDNDTTTGTTYNAGSVPANTTFGTNGSIKNAYDALITRTSTLIKTANSTNYSITASANSSETTTVTMTFPAGYKLIGLFDVSTNYPSFVRNATGDYIGTSYSSNTNVSIRVRVNNLYGTSLTFTGHIVGVFIKNL